MLDGGLDAESDDEVDQTVQQHLEETTKRCCFLGWDPQQIDHVKERVKLEVKAKRDETKSLAVQTETQPVHDEMLQSQETRTRSRRKKRRKEVNRRCSACTKVKNAERGRMKKSRES